MVGLTLANIPPHFVSFAPVVPSDDDGDEREGHGEDEAAVVVGVLADQVHAAGGNAAAGGRAAEFLQIISIKPFEQAMLGVTYCIQNSHLFEELLGPGDQTVQALNLLTHG